MIFRTQVRFSNDHQVEINNAVLCKYKVKYFFLNIF